METNPTNYSQKLDYIQKSRLTQSVFVVNMILISEFRKVSVMIANINKKRPFDLEVQYCSYK